MSQKSHRYFVSLLLLPAAAILYYMDGEKKSPQFGSQIMSMSTFYILYSTLYSTLYNTVLQLVITFNYSNLRYILYYFFFLIIICFHNFYNKLIIFI